MEKIESLAQSCGKEPQRLYQEQEENDVPHRYRNSNTFKRHRDSNSNLGQATFRQGIKASGVTNRSATKGPSVRSTPKHIRGPINLKPGPSGTPKQAVREAGSRDPGTVKHSSDDSEEDTPLSSYIPTKREEQKRLLLEKRLFEEEEKQRKEEEKQRKEEGRQRKENLDSLTAAKFSGLTGLTITKRIPTEKEKQESARDH